jgi:hypothetical protein
LVLTKLNFFVHLFVTCVTIKGNVCIVRIMRIDLKNYRVIVKLGILKIKQLQNVKNVFTNVIDVMTSTNA